MTSLPRLVPVADGAKRNASTHAAPGSSLTFVQLPGMRNALLPSRVTRRISTGVLPALYKRTFVAVLRVPISCRPKSTLAGCTSSFAVARPVTNGGGSVAACAICQEARYTNIADRATGPMSAMTSNSHHVASAAQATIATRRMPAVVIARSIQCSSGRRQRPSASPNQRASAHPRACRTEAGASARSSSSGDRIRRSRSRAPPDGGARTTPRPTACTLVSRPPT